MGSSNPTGICPDDGCRCGEAQSEAMANRLRWSLPKQFDEGRHLHETARRFIEPGFEDYVCKLVHTIYGTMQGGHDWYETLSTTFNQLGYITSRADPCVQIKKVNGDYTVTTTYTDDIFGASNSDEEIKGRKDEIGRVWEIKDVGESEYFLGMR